MSARAGDPLTLSRALRLAADNSLQAEVAGLANASSQEETRQVQALYLPEVTLEGGHLNLSRQPTLMTPSEQLGPFSLPPQPMPLADQSAWSYKASASYLLYDWGRRAKALAATRAKSDSIALGGTDQIRRLQAEVTARYAGLMTLQAQKKVVAQRSLALEAHLKVVKDLVDQGIVANNDLLRTQVILRTVQDMARALDRACQSQLEALNAAMGLAPETPQTLPEALPPPPEPAWNEAACRTLAGASNSAVKALRAKLKAQEEQVALRQRDYAPTLGAEAAHVYGQNAHMLSAHENTLFIGLSWKVFDGGIRQSRVSQARSEETQARREVLEAQRQAGNAAASALRDVQQALLETETAQSNVASAQENLRITEDQYQEGIAHNTDVLDAEAVLAESRSAFNEKRCRVFAQEAVLLAALGQDLPSFFDPVSTVPAPPEK